MSKAIAIIPARGGSKRIPRKNIKDFHGKPLIAYSIETALQSGLFEKVVVSTDDDEIADVAKKYGAEVLKRPDKLADDFTGTDAVIEHAIEVLKKKSSFKYVCTIYATAPFLEEKYLKQGFEEISKERATMVFSATSMPYPIQRTFKLIEGNRCQMFTPEHFFARSQDLEEAYHDAGQFYWKNLDREFNDIPLGKDSIAIVLPRYLVQDIDTLEDWKSAEYMFHLIEEKKQYNKEEIAEIPLFDALSHPSYDGSWVMPKVAEENSISHIKTVFKKYHVQWAFVVNLDENANDKYATYFQQDKNLFPIYLFNIHNFHSMEEIKEKFSNLKKEGFWGIKIHSRLSGVTLSDKSLVESINLAREFGLIIMICTYFHADDKGAYKNNDLSLVKLLVKTKGAKIILLHGGLTKVLTYMDIVKPFPNVLLDLSYTFIKYAESSLDKDFEYIFNHFDRRVCVGSDSPDYKIAQFRERFNAFIGKGIPRDKLENIAYKNLLRLVGREDNV